MKRIALLAAFAFVLACPKPPAAVMASIEKPEHVTAIRDAFNADAAHRRVLVLLSPH